VNKFKAVMRNNNTYVLLILAGIGVFGIQCSNSTKRTSENSSAVVEKEKEYNPMAIDHFMEGSIPDLQEKFESAIKEYELALKYDSPSEEFFK